MTYQSDGSQTNDKAKAFLGAKAEEIIDELRRKREAQPGEYAFKGQEDMGISSPGRVENYV
jgi:hypothetical protein